MRAVIQRVCRAKVICVDTGEITGEIGPGMLVLLGVGQNDALEEVYYLARKIAEMRIFDDEDAKMNRSLNDIDGQILLVSQFTLYADCRKGRRPGFTGAAAPAGARKLYRFFVEILRVHHGCRVELGAFQKAMHVELVNDGPVTLILDTEEMAPGLRKDFDAT